MRIAVLMTCHNRREQTVRCLERLQAQGFPLVEPENRVGGDEAASRARLSVFLVDDGSTDGTAEAVRVHFPTVRIVAGDGNLYWCGGMRLAWKQAVNAGFDAYLWLNDDTLLLSGALATLLQTARDVACRSNADDPRDDARDDFLSALIVVGSTCDPDTGAPTYGECCPSGALAPPVGRPRDVAWSLNGNIVLVTDATYRILGSHSPAYRHSFGDVDYGIRARQAGIPVIVAPGFLGECRANGVPKWQRSEVPLAERWRALHGPKGISARQLRHLMRVQGKGVWWLSMARLYCTVVAPRWFARGRHAP